MNKQRKVLITITYNEMGIIIDTKAEEVAQPEVETQMSLADCISREDALNCFHDWIDSRGDVHTADEMPEFQRIEQLPTAEPKTGKWIDAYPDIEPNPMFMYGICSECGCEQAISNKLNFCPDCGADMRGEDDD